MIIKTCAHCPNEFEAKRKNVKYCSDSCSNKAAYARKPKPEPKPKKPSRDDILMDGIFVPYTDHELHLNDLPRKEFEGKGEKARRFQLGLPLDAVNGAMDIPEVKEEVKSLVSANGGLDLSFRWGKASEDESFGLAFEMIVEASLISVDDEPLVDLGIRKSFRRGVVPLATLQQIPDPFRGRIHDLWRLKNVASEHEAIILHITKGWLRVPFEDFDKAFHYVTSSQSRFKYAVSWNYLLSRHRVST